MQLCVLFWSLLLCAHTFTADQQPSYGSYESSEFPDDEEIIKKMQAAATPWWGAKGFEQMLIQVPGEHRFYKRLALRNGITGLLSGAKKIDVEVIALQIAIDPQEDAREMVLKLSEIYEVALAAKKLERLCDILLPDELHQYVVDLVPCTHENNECNNYWHYVKATLEQHAIESTAKHFGVIMVPYQQ